MAWDEINIKRTVKNKVNLSGNDFIVILPSLRFKFIIFLFNSLTKFIPVILKGHNKIAVFD